MYPNYNNFNGMNNGRMNNSPMNFIQQFAQFKKSFQGDPQQAVLNLLNNGQMSQQQFNQLQNMANQIMNSMGKTN